MQDDYYLLTIKQIWNFDLKIIFFYFIFTSFSKYFIAIFFWYFCEFFHLQVKIK